MHAHVVLGTSDGTTRGGHLLEARVRPTLEVIVVESPEHLRPKTKEAVVWIRHFRTGKSRPPDTGELAEEIVRAVKEYGLRHPGLSREQELEALRLANETLADGRLMR